MKTVDARGLSCPQPVLLAKQMADQGESEFVVLVDNATARENISRFSNKAGFQMEISGAEDDIVLHLKKKL